MQNSILLVINAIKDSTSPYNEHVLYRRQRNPQSIYVCHFLNPTIEVPENLPRYSGHGSVFRFVNSIRRALQSANYKVVHIHAPVAGFIYCIYCHFFARRYLSNSVYTVHTSYQNFKLLHKAMAAIIFLSLGKIVCCSHSSAASLPGWLRFLAGNRLTVIQNGVDLDRIDDNSITTQETSKYVEFIFVGRLEKIKHPETILKAFATLNNNSHIKARLSFVGEGSLKQSLLRAAADYGLKDRVTFHGSVTREKVFKLLNQSQYFISASEVEGFPVAVLESIACGCTPILSDIQPHTELVQSLPDSVAISTFPIGSSEILADGMEIEATTPKEKRIKQTDDLLEHVRNHFSLNAMIKEYDQVYMEIGSAD